MDRTLRRLFSILLCICVTLGMMSGAVAYAQGTEEQAAASGETVPDQTTACMDETVPAETTDFTQEPDGTDAAASTGETLANSETGETNPTGETGPSEETDPTGETDPSEMTDPTGETDPSEMTDPTGETDPSEETDPTGETDPSEVTDPTGGTNPSEVTDPTGETDPSETTDPSEESTDPTDSTEVTYPWDEMTDEEFLEFMLTEGYSPYAEDADALASLSARVEQVADEEMRLFLAAILEAFQNHEDFHPMDLMAVPYAASSGSITLAELNSSGMFFKQNGRGTCTLTANAMMVRRAARLNGYPYWSSIGENSLRSTAWIEGVGMCWNYTYAGITVAHTDVSSSTMEQFLAFLRQHPEGFVAYNKNKPHAVLITDYDKKTGTIYCADPGLSDQRMPLEQSVLRTGNQTSTVKGFTAYWYVSSPKLTLAPTPPPLEERVVEVTAAVNKDNTVSLSWTNTGAAGYRVYRCGNPNGPWGSAIYNAVGAGSVTWTDTTTSAFQTYYYCVVSYNAAGTPCYCSEAVSCTPDNMVAELYGNSLTLNGDIGLNFYVVLPEPLAADSGAYALVNGSKCMVSGATVSEAAGKTLHKFSCKVASPAMGVRISFRLYDGKGQIVKLMKDRQDITDTYSYSIADYYHAASQTNNSKLKPLVEAMVNYGHYSQLHFGTGVPVAAPAGFSMDAANLTALSGYAPQVTGSVSGLNYRGSSVVLESETTIKHYFILDEGRHASDYAVTVDGVAAQMEVSGNTCVIRIPNVTAPRLGVAHRVVVSKEDGSIVIDNYSAFSYAYMAVNNNSSEGLMNTVRALYCYGMAAKNYFGV